MAVVRCPDWPVVAWGVPLDEPAVVVSANRVVACSPGARSHGVAVGQRRREAQGRCPDVAVLERDVDREAQLFEPVALALEAITPRVEITRAGVVGFPTKGPSRFFGGDAALAGKVLDIVEPVLGGRGECRVAIADGIFAARLATRANRSCDPVVVPVGESPEFLKNISINELGQPSLVDVLRRLGLTTLGSFAALSPADVVGRFGREGQLAHRLARGEDSHAPDLRRPAVDLGVSWQFEPAAVDIERCALVAKTLADELEASLLSNGLACVRVAIEAETTDGQTHLRLWRHEGALSANDIAQRTRWQLDGWLHAARVDRQQIQSSSSGSKSSGNKSSGSKSSASRSEDREPDDVGVGAAIETLRLIPDQVVAAVGRQLGFWGGRAERADEVTRAVARIQGLLGSESVSVPEWSGGRGPGEQISLIPAAAVDLGAERSGDTKQWLSGPWPGNIPLPAPSKVWTDPNQIEVLDAAGDSVMVSGRGEFKTPPACVSLASTGSYVAITEWSSPWPADERWWDELSHRRRARFQVVLEDTSAHLVAAEDGCWWLEASYL